MKIGVIGTGYVGLVTGACLAQVGHSVTCMDQDQGKIALLQGGGMPLYEAGLAELVAANTAQGRLRFTTAMAEALQGAELLFLAVGTPEGEDGSADLSYVLAAAAEIGQRLTGPLILVQKSTCPVGTAAQVEEQVRSALALRGVAYEVAVLANPEFLREGSAVPDFMKPDRVVIGAQDEAAGQKLASLYASFVPPERILLMDRASAELTKYAANGFLATKISFINEIANLCELVGADVEQVRRGMGSDPRIGPAFLAAGVGYGGSCFPKDVKALAQVGATRGLRLRLVEATEAINRSQRERQVMKLLGYFGGSLSGRRIALWGLAFKPGTDDLREAPAIYLIQRLLALGAEVVAYDPVAMAQATRLLAGRLTDGRVSGDGMTGGGASDGGALDSPGSDGRLRFASNAEACLEGADALLLVTEWPEFQQVDLNRAGERMKERLLFDLRNAIDPDAARQSGFSYFGVGRGAYPLGSGGAERWGG